MMSRASCHMISDQAQCYTHLARIPKRGRSTKVTRKMSAALLFLIVTTNVVFASARDVAPVVIWGIKSAPTGVNPCAVMPASEFEEFLNKNIEPTTPVVVFYKNDLCSEDLTQNTEQLQPLHQMGVKYMGQVESPFGILNNLPTHNVTMIDSVDYVMDSQVVLTEVENLDSVVKTYQTVKDSSPNVVGVLTGRECKFAVNERSKREDTNDTSAIIISEANTNKGVLAYIRKGIWMKKKGEDNFRNLGKPNTATLSGDGKKESPLNVLINYSTESAGGKLVVKLVLVMMSTGYWNLSEVVVDDNNHLSISADRIMFPANFSYQCAENVTYVDNWPVSKANYQIRFRGIQLQIFDGPKLPKNFSDAYDCVGFVSIPILTGLMITLLFAIIITWGLTMILDIKTMDRFDDPKGKNIMTFSNE